MTKVDLLVAPCDYKAAKYAVMNWHYSKAMPVGKLVKFGVWENDKFIGCVLFGRGANNNIGKPYNLEQTEVCELVRVALTNHSCFVSEIMAKCFSILKSQNIKLVVSYADTEQNHIGIIYQASNWIYEGIVSTTPKYMLNGKFVHAKSVHGAIGSVEGLDRTKSGSKHKYLYPLTRAMRRQIMPLAKPYPRPVKGDSFMTNEIASFDY